MKCCITLPRNLTLLPYGVISPCKVPLTSLALSSLPLHSGLTGSALRLLSSFPASPQPPATPALALLSLQVDELMRQELKSLRLAVDREEDRPFKALKAR